jgi:hypothetical protein
VTDIDTRARAATSALLASVDAAADVAPTPRRSPLPRLAFAAVVVVAVVAGGLAFARRDDGRTTAVASGAGAPRLIVDPAPDGLALAGVFDPPAGAAVSVATFGTGDAEDPYRDADLLVAVRAETAGEDAGSGGSATAVTVQGTSGSLEETDFGVTLAFRLAPDRVVTVASRTLSADEIVQAADALRIDGTDTTVDGELPRGLTPVAHGDIALGGLVQLIGPDAHVAFYADGTGESQLTVASAQGDASSIAVMRWTFAGGSRVISFGHSGVIGVLEPGEQPLRELAFERDGHVVVITGRTSEEALLDAASHLRPASDEEWAAAGHDVARQPGVPADALASLEGELSATDTWAAYVDSKGSLCARVQSGDSDSFSCSSASIDSPPDQRVYPSPLTVHDNGGTERLVVGVSPAGATRVALDSGAAQVDAQTTAFGQSLLYAGTLDPFPTQVIFYAADGSELARQPVNQ